MPELPEVETITRLIRPGLLGRRLQDVQAAWPRSLGGESVQGFRGKIRDRRVVWVWRRGKFIVLDMQLAGKPAGALLVHLRMTGRLYLLPRGAPAEPHTRVRLLLDRGSLHLHDVRKFARMRHVPDVGLALAKLGPEPLDPEFDAARLRTILRAHRRLLKPLLLDQHLLAGLGNIYVDEALHRARLHPLSRSDRVSAGATRRLHREIQTTLREAIKQEGSSFDRFYRTPEGQPGRFQHQFQVYGRAGQPCRHCGRSIRKIVVAQRGTHFCPRCQRRPPGVS